MPPRRVLVDLSHAADGYVGIAQDIRLIFAMLARLEDAEPTGLLMPVPLHDLPRLRGNAGEQVALQAGIVHWMSRAAGMTPRRSRLGRLIAPAFEVRRVLRRPHATVKMRPELRDSIWRVLFEQTLPPSDRALVTSQGFIATDLSIGRLLYRTGAFPKLKPVTLDAAGYDAVLFCNARPIRLPAGVQPLVRYHDAIPLTDADMTSHWQSGATHQRMLEGCDPRTIFVCDSPASVQDLALAAPAAVERARIIPCALAPITHAASTTTHAAIFASRRTFRSLGRDPGVPPAIDAAPRYVLSVSAFEPRKNFVSLVRAWERVTGQDPSLKLVLVAGKGWLEEEGLRIIAPHVAAGRILHLHGVPPDELQSLLKGAACFAFPSFAEGFGLPPLEAMQAGTPVIASDLPVFRWTMGDAALFIDPYDVDSLAAAIGRLCIGVEREGLRADMIARGLRAVERFSPDAVSQQWSALLESLPGRG